MFLFKILKLPVPGSTLSSLSWPLKFKAIFQLLKKGRCCIKTRDRQEWAYKKRKEKKRGRKEI